MKNKKAKCGFFCCYFFKGVIELNKEGIMIINFMRHGECKNQGEKRSEKFDEELTHLGKKQTKMAVKYLRDCSLSVIYASPKRRCIETAKIIAKKLKLPLIILTDLVERVGIKNPQTKEEIEAYNRYLDLTFESKDFQTCRQFVDLVQKELKNIIKTHKKREENVLIVGHSSNLYALNSYFYGDNGKDVVWSQCSNCAVIRWEV